MTEPGLPQYVILHQYGVDPEGDTRRKLWPEFVPKLKEIPGFVAVYTFDDPDAREGVSLTFWETEAAAQAYIDSDARQKLDTLASEFRSATDRRIMRIFQADDPRR